MNVILALGSNKGDRLAYLKQAVAEITHMGKNIICSPIYESPALLPYGAPEEWNKVFLNMALSCDTALAPQELLSAVKRIEEKLGRIPTGHWGPREIDIDILSYGSECIHETNLIIPHAGLLIRDFALIPLANIAPDWAYPVKGEFYNCKASELVSNLVSGLRKTDYAL